MSIIAWIVFGLVSGFLASKLVNGRGDGLLTNLGLGVIGSIVGGGVFHFLGDAGITGFNLWSVFVAVVGAVLVLATFHMISGGRARV